MKLCIEPEPAHEWSLSDLEFVICLNNEDSPRVFVEPGQPKPDRHLLLGIVQNLVMAVEERDPDLVEFCRPRSIRLEAGDESLDLACDFIIFRGAAGWVGALAPEDASVARTISRRALRWFTGTVRLDVP